MSRPSRVVPRGPREVHGWPEEEAKKAPVNGTETRTDGRFRRWMARAVGCFLGLAALAVLAVLVRTREAALVPTSSPSEFVNDEKMESYAPLTCNFKSVPPNFDFQPSPLSSLRGQRPKVSTLLKNHSPHNSTIREDELHYFQVCVNCRSNQAQDLQFDIRLESLRGDTNLYVSVDTMWPSPERAEFISNNRKIERITFKASNHILQNVLSVVPGAKLQLSSTGVILPQYVYISVLGYVDSEYSLTVDVTRA